jgi:hypothetical protein
MGAPHLTSEDIERAVSLLAGWAGELTWNDFSTILGSRLESGHVYSKVALSKHEKITTAFRNAKARLKKEAGDVGEESYGRSAVAVLRRKLDQTNAELKRANELNQELIEQFIRWQFNAERFGVKRQQLNAPLVNPAKKKAAGDNR